MRRSVFIAGVAVLAIGALLGGVAFLESSASETIPSNESHQALLLTPSLLGSGTAKLSWSGATAQFRFSVYQCTDSACSSYSPSPLANGAGSSGSVQFTVSGGTTYEVASSAGGENAVPVTVALSGLTFLLLIALVVVVVGAVIAFLGFRMKPAVRLAPAVEEEAPVKEMFVTRPFSGSDETGSAEAAEAATPAYRPQGDEPTGPVFFEPTVSSAPAADAGTAPAKGRAPIKCSHCGTMNDFWLTTCRNCRRPLAKTG